MTLSVIVCYACFIAKCVLKGYYIMSNAECIVMSLIVYLWIVSIVLFMAGFPVAGFACMANAFFMAYLTEFRINVK